jgi:hypothetical protein
MQIATPDPNTLAKTAQLRAFWTRSNGTPHAPETQSGANGEKDIMADEENYEARPKTGRPRALDPDPETLARVIDQLYGMGKIQCTLRECAACLRVAHQTLLDFMKRHPEARTAWEDGLEEGRRSLRRTQFKIAEGGNAAMAIFLGKNYLAQKDAKDIRGTGPGGSIAVLDLKAQVADLDPDQLSLLEKVLSDAVLSSPDSEIGGGGVAGDRPGGEGSEDL